MLPRRSRAPGRLPRCVISDIKVRGNLKTRFNITGNVDVNHANIGIPSGFPSGVAVLDVRRPGQAGVVSKDSCTIGLQVEVHAPRRILAQDRGLDAELGGNLGISGTLEAPRIGGGLELVRGSFTLAGTHLAFTDSHVTFSGTGLDGKIDPRLDFTASSGSAQVSSTLRISGFADSRRFEFGSSPSLPQDEIMARLLFGQSAADLSALQVVRIGVALASLKDGGGFDPLAKIQRNLGLDRLSIECVGNGANAAQTAGASIAAGRYVSKRVYLEARQSTTGNSQLQVNADLTKRLKLQTRLGNSAATAQGANRENDPGSSVGLSYEIEY